MKANGRMGIKMDMEYYLTTVENCMKVNLKMDYIMDMVVRF